MRLAILVCLVVMISGCGSGNTDARTATAAATTTADTRTVTVTGTEKPQWLVDLIADLESSPIRNPPSSVIRYQYQGEAVYYLPAECCDQMSTLYDAAGNKICSPDGGITGRGDGSCPDFSRAGQDGEVVWEDPRA